MADHEFGQHTNWWDTSSRTSPAAANSMGSFGWPPGDIKSRSSMESVSVSGSSAILQGSDSAGGDGGGLVDPNLHMMGLGLSSQAMEWNQALQRGEKSEGGFRSMLEENGSFQFSSSMDSSGVYGAPGTLLQGLFGSDQHQNQHHQSQQHPHSFTSRLMNTNYQYNPANYGMISGTNDLSAPGWSKVPQFLRTSPPHSPLQFSNNSPFWNSSAAAMPDVRPSFFPPSQTQFPTLTFDDNKPTKVDDTFGQRGEMGSKSAAVTKKSSEPAPKRPRKESASPLPAFKVRKEKMGDRITALQQLVSPFGKTDTASVLSEAIEYIKFLHEQVSVLSTPYMKSGAPIPHRQSSEKSSKDHEGPKQDLRSRGLCLVPVSSTFPVAHETAVDFWNPTFGGTFR